METLITSMLLFNTWRACITSRLSFSFGAAISRSNLCTHGDWFLSVAKEFRTLHKCEYFVAAWWSLSVLIQAVRNEHDLGSLLCPPKYHTMNSFWTRDVTISNSLYWRESWSIQVLTGIVSCCICHHNFCLCNFIHRAIWEFNQFVVYIESNMLLVLRKLLNVFWQIERNQLGSKAGEQLNLFDH
jgi:hypothetical protein